MPPLTPSSAPIAYKPFRPKTPPGQTSIVWELGNVPIPPGFYNPDRDEQLNGRTLPRVQATHPDPNFSHPFKPFLPKVSQRYRLPNFISPQKPRELLPAFSPKRKRSQRDLSGSSNPDIASPKVPKLSIIDLLWNMKTASLEYHHREIDNGSSAYNQVEKEAIVKELARREKGAEDH